MLDEKIIELFFKWSDQAINELDSKYGKVFHKLSYPVMFAFTAEYDTETLIKVAENIKVIKVEEQK